MSSHSKTGKRSVSIFFKAALLSLVVSALTLSVFAWAMVRHEKRMLLEQLKERGNLLASSLDRVTANAIVAEDWESVISQCLKMIEMGEHVDYLLVTNMETGFSLIHTQESWRMETLNTPWSNPPGHKSQAAIRVNPLSGDGQEIMHYSHAFSYSGIDWGWIHVGITLDDYYHNLQRVMGIIMRLSIPAIASGVVSSFLFARHLTRPISRLKDFAQRVASGDLDHQLAIKEHDEVGALGAAMNQMTMDLKKSNEKLQVSMQQEARLREKEILLKEIHHRVKNNMQILSSLLRMQAREVDGDQIKSFLSESESRIRSMGLIHEKLYQSQNISEVDFNAYVETLASQLIGMHSRQGGDISLKVDIDDIHLGLDTAMPCGLIVNELVSNSLKYAFPGGRDGTISIKVVPEKTPGHYRLTIADDGVGISGEKPVREGALGSRLVEMLVDQLDGKVDYRNGVGTSVHIEFYESEYTERV